MKRYPYHHVTTINWEKGFAWQVVRSALGLFMSAESIDNMPRPYFSEQPALMIVIASGMLLGVMVSPIVTVRTRSTKHR
jgi:hypothetical protein